MTMKIDLSYHKISCCILGQLLSQTYCGGRMGDCLRCGWNVNVYERRLARIRNGALRRGEDGLFRLYV